MNDRFINIGVGIGFLNKDRVVSPSTDKEKRISEIKTRAHWIEEHPIFVKELSQVGGKKVTNTLEALVELENLTCGQLRMLQNETNMTERNQNSVHRENDEMLFCAGGIMWGGLFISPGENTWKDLVTGEKFPLRKGHGSAKMHILPFGIPDHITGLARQSSSLIAMDMPRVMESLESREHSILKIDSVSYDATLNAARFMYEQYGFRIHSIWAESSPILTFPGWTELSKRRDVVLKLFAPSSEFGKIWDNSLTYMEKVIDSLKIENRFKFAQYEVSLRKLGLAINVTKPDVIQSNRANEWWKIYKPSFIR